ncbi:hypothetical protein [Melittangium boletus]|uniref:PE-PGRS family protein n=1 Tax=Melittangium boletus DSM 14713 TaxID=1294270 RepID=A0A250IG72_9BACT|nr:hypothetical protein [Melittangium boletus]ATB30213.1 PE-PGRS family protein [Melittangium boletus DSM 14713]
MRGAIWMALALVGTAPLALAQPATGAGVRAPQAQQPAAGPSGAASIEQGQDSAGTTSAFGTTGQPAGGALFPGIPGLNGIPLQDPAAQGNTSFGTGGAGTGGAGSGPTYRGAPEAPVDTGTPAASATPSAGQGADLNNLNQRVGALEREVSALRGTGGAGPAPSTTAPAAPAAPAQNMGTTPGTAAPAPSDNAAPIPAITVEFDGRVRDVTPQYVEVVDSTDGTVSRLRIDDQTRVFRGSARNRIPVKQLSEGAQVRTSFAYVDGEELARDIIVLSRGSQR